MNKERFEQQRAFILEADKEKNILRQTHISGYTRRENDAEHAWHMALMIYLLKEYANEPFDTERAMMMALIHDIVEIDAGDTYAYDTAALETQAEREAQAAERIFGLLPEDQKTELRTLFEEFEACETPEARFARAMDNLQPLLLNDCNGGRDWKRHGIRAAQVLKRQERSRAGSEEIWHLSRDLIQRNVARGNLKGDAEQASVSAAHACEIRRLTEDNQRDLYVSNTPFAVIGKLRVTFADGSWHTEEVLSETVMEKQYPNYDGAMAKDYLRDGDRAAYLAYSEGACVGQILLAKSRNGYAHIEDLCVTTARRGQGVGTALLETAEAWAREKGLEAFSLECRDNNVLASRFFKKHGFSVGGVNTALYAHLGKPYDTETALFWYKSLL